MSEALSYSFDFETVEVLDPESNQNSVESNDEEEFAFRLFSGPSEASSITKVSLKVDNEEEYQPKRPESYYYANTSDEQKRQISIAAVDYDTLFKDLELAPIDPWPRKLVSLAELQKSSGTKKHKNRKGLKQRKQRIETKLKLARAKRALKHSRSRPKYRKRAF